jgi:hypothetical protein
MQKTDWFAVTWITEKKPVGEPAVPVKKSLLNEAAKA